MAYPSSHPVREFQIIATGGDFALLSMTIPELSQSLLVQVFGGTFAPSRAYSLYSVYREGSMTFDAIIRIEVTNPKATPEELLMYFVHSVEFERAVLQPLMAQVRRHFAT